MCGAEIKILIDSLIESATNLLELHNGEDGGYICRPCLANMESIVKRLRSEYNKDEQENKSTSTN